MLKKLKNKTNEEGDNDKGDSDSWRRVCPPTCIDFWTVDSADHWI